MSARFPLTYDGVTLEIERIREAAGRDAAKLDALSLELENYLREAAPNEPLLARCAQVILENYRLLAGCGFFPKVFREEEL